SGVPLNQSFALVTTLRNGRPVSHQEYLRPRGGARRRWPKALSRYIGAGRVLRPGVRGVLLFRRMRHRRVPARGRGEVARRLAVGVVLLGLGLAGALLAGCGGESHRTAEGATGEATEQGQAKALAKIPASDQTAFVQIATVM